MTKEMITLSRRKLDLVSAIQTTINRQITQVKRLVHAYRNKAATGLISRHPVKAPNNLITDTVRQQALALIRANAYGDISA